jgi:hypothetical protein
MAILNWVGLDNCSPNLIEDVTSSSWCPFLHVNYIHFPVLVCPPMTISCFLFSFLSGNPLSIWLPKISRPLHTHLIFSIPNTWPRTATVWGLQSPIMGNTSPGWLHSWASSIQGGYSWWIPLCGQLFSMAFGHVNSDHDLVSSHKLTRSGMNHTQRGNPWGNCEGLWEEGEWTGDLKAMGASAPPVLPPPLRSFGLIWRKGEETEGWAAGGLLPRMVSAQEPNCLQ